MAQEHLNYPDIGILKHHGCVGMPEKVRCGVLFKNSLREVSNERLNCPGADISPAGYSGEKVGVKGSGGVGW